MSLAPYLDAVRRQNPLVDCITNIVTAGDMANGLLAIGASPVMAADPEEISEIISHARAMLYNLGAISLASREAARRGSLEANTLGIPLVIDPVGVGASHLRLNMVKELAASRHIAILRGNVSEIRALTGASSHAGGVDAAAGDLDAGHFEEMQETARRLASQWQTVVAVSGPRDIVTDGTRLAVIDAGCDMMTRVTGTGCTLTGLTAAFAAVCGGNYFEAAICSLVLMCLAGEQAQARAGHLGTASFRTAMFDALSKIEPHDLDDRKAVTYVH
jgi:hydroxyethylthiazole kinase